MSDVLWEDMIKQPPPPPPPAPPMPPPPMGGMPPPPGMGMNTPDPPGKIVQDAPGTQQETVAVDPDKEEDDDEQVEKGAIQDWQRQLQGGGAYAQTPTGIYMPNQTNPQQTQQPQPAETDQTAVQRDNVQGYQQNQQYDRRGAVGSDTQLYDMDDKNINEYWDAMIEAGQIPANQKPTKGSLAWINPLTFDDGGKEVNADWSNKTQQKTVAQPKKEQGWFSKVTSAPFKAVDAAADAVFGTDEEIKNQKWRETITTSPRKRLDRRAKRQKAEQLVANKKKTGQNVQSTNPDDPYESTDMTWRDV